MPAPLPLVILGYAVGPDYTFLPVLFLPDQCIAVAFLYRGGKKTWGKITIDKNNKKIFTLVIDIVGVAGPTSQK
jgi:hypothetical protein